MVVFGFRSNQWSICVFAGMYMCILLGVICDSPNSFQNWLSGAYYDLSSSSVGVAWKSPPISMVTVGNLDVIPVCIHVRISV